MNDALDRFLCQVKDCGRMSDKHVTFKGQRLRVCDICYEIIIKKVADRMKNWHPRKNQ